MSPLPGARFPTVCDRCHGSLLISTMSKFNTDIICASCDEKERAHPAYDQAVAADIDAVKQGNFNFRGIGKPRDL